MGEPTAGSKRQHPSTSDESDSSFCDANGTKPDRKRQNITSDASMDEMRAAIVNINKQLECLDTLATKDNMRQISSELKALRDNFDTKIEVIEGRLLDIEARQDKAERELTAEKRRNEALKNALKDQELRVKQCEKEQNEAQQYSRRWNVRVFKVPEDSKETAADCVTKVCRLFTDAVGVRTSPEDIEVAHRAGQRSSTKPRPILVRFLNRGKRDAVMVNMRRLKGKGVSINEDLTPANYRLLAGALQHSATMTAWSWNGRVLAKVKNGHTVRLNIHMDLDEAFRRAMTSAQISDEENS